MSKTAQFPDTLCAAIFTAKAAAAEANVIFTKKDVLAVIKAEWVKELARTSTKKGANIPPSIEEVKAYFAEIAYKIDAEAWWFSYDQKGWMVGKVRMKNWRSACQNWKRNGWQPGGDSTKPTKPAKREDDL